MQQYTFCVPEQGPALFLFDISAIDRPTAVNKAKAALNEHLCREADLHVDVSYGLTFGRLTIDPEHITERNIVDEYFPPADKEPF